MHDTHCHIDLYKNPFDVASATERAALFTVAVTNLPSAYYAAQLHMRQFRHLKLALGMHPLLAQHHTARERQLFKQAFQETQYIGEIGLDFSKEQIATKDKQVETFRFVLELLQQEHKVATLHSRRAETSVLELLTEYEIKPAIFHWYSGSVTVLDRILQAGHFCSVNPAMIQSANGQKIIGRIPKERLLTETDGPFVSVSQRPAVPADVNLVQLYLSEQWGVSLIDVEHQLATNLKTFLQIGQQTE